MISSIIELVVLSLPSFFYRRRLERRGQANQDARAAVGWCAGSRRSYGLAIVVAVVTLPLAYGAQLLIPSQTLGASGGGLHVTLGQSADAAGYVAIVLLAVAEEIFFRGFVAGVAFRRYGFARGNVLQALIFLAPHLFLLVVSTSIWPILPVQLAAGWLLGALRYNSDSIGPSSLAHAGTNLLALVLLAAFH